MSSGTKRIVHNTRERLISTDHNREQAFASYATAELLRYMLDASTSEDGAAGNAIVGTVITDPLRAVIVNGVMARPEIGTVNLFVDPGVLCVVQPDAVPSADDSPLKWIVEPGIALTGQLVLTPGGGGATRIDVIECQAVEAVLEQDNRDIFNPATGLFAPSLIDKVKTHKLTYRIRLGTAGGGFPGTASGWLPLAVASVPNTATTWNDVKLWDVRPLANDFVNAPFNVTQAFPHSERSHAVALGVGGGSNPRTLRGIIETQYLGRKLGGNLAPLLGSSGSIDLLDTSLVVEPGFAAVAGLPWYVYLCVPFGLPRWAEYTPHTSGVRIPRSPRGIPIFTQKVPASLAGRPSVAISLPSGLGLGGTVQDAVVAIAGGYDLAGGNFLDTVVSDGWTQLQQPGLQVNPSGGSGTSVVTYALVDNTTHPVNVTELRIRFSTTITGAADSHLTVDRVVTINDSAGGNSLYNRRFTSTETIPSGGSFTDRFEFDLPIHPNLPNGTPITREVSVTYVVGGVAVTYSAQNAFIMGWKLA